MAQLKFDAPISITFTINLTVPVLLDGVPQGEWPRAIQKQVAAEIELAIRDCARSWGRVRHGAVL